MREWGSRLRLGGGSWRRYKRDIGEKEIEAGLAERGRGVMGKLAGKA